MSLMKIVAQLVLDGTKFKAGLREAQSGMRNWASDFGSSVKGEIAAVFGGAAIASYIKNTIQSIGALKDQAEQARVTTAEFQRLGIAAEAASLKEEDWINGQVAFDKNRREAVESNYELRKTFEKYGFTLDDLQNPQKRFIDFLQAANTAMESMTPEQKARASVELFDILGKLGPKVQGFLQEVEKHKNDPIVSDKSIESVKKADDALAKLGRRVRIVLADKITNPLQILAGPINAWRTLRGVFTGNFGEDEGGGKPKNTSSLTEEEGNELLEEREERLKKIAEYQKTLEGIRGSEGLSDIVKDELARPWERAIGEQRERVDEIDKATGAGDEQLHKDKIAERQNREALDARLQLEQAILKVKLEQMTATQQQVEREKLLAGQLDMVAFLEGQGFDAFAERQNAISTLSEIMRSAPATPANSSLTQTGQWNGRAYMNQSESPFVAEAKKILNVAIDQKTILQKIEQKKGFTIGGGT